MDVKTNEFCKERVQEILFKLLDYCKGNDWAGYDPYDALNSKLLNLLPFLDFWFFRLGLTQLLKRSPINIRTLLMVPKMQNPKALGLFLMALTKLSKLGLLNQEDLTKHMVERLIALRSPNTDYWCWGYSFPWQTRTILVPRWSPNLVGTTFVANALLDAYEVNQQAECLDMALSAANYILKELYWEDDSGAACFAYPLPSSRSRIHNANFLGAALLCRAWKASADSRFLEPALKAVRYSASAQNEDGSWNYGEDATQQWIDNFHTGYNLCALKAITTYGQTSEFEQHIRQGFEFYKERFFTDEGAPKYFHNNTYPIDIHSAAQSVITLVTLESNENDGGAMARNVLKWTVDNMWDERGYFYYQVYRGFKIRTAYMRWSQAWMLYALASLLTHTEHATDFIL